MLTAGEMRLVPPGAPLQSLWPRLWALTADDDGANDDDDAMRALELSDGTEVWWRATQCGAAEAGQLAASAPSELADEALGEWRKYFAEGVAV